MNKKMTFLAVPLTAVALMGTGCVTDGSYGYTATTVYPAESYTTGACYVAPAYVETVPPITYIETVQPVGYVETRYVAPPPRYHRGGHHRPPARVAPPPRPNKNSGFTSRPIGSRPTQARPAARPTGAPVRQPTRPAMKPANAPARQPARPTAKSTSASSRQPSRPPARSGGGGRRDRR